MRHVDEWCVKLLSGGRRNCELTRSNRLDGSPSDISVPTLPTGTGVRFKIQPLSFSVYAKIRTRFGYDKTMSVCSVTFWNKYILLHLLSAFWQTAVTLPSLSYPTVDNKKTGVLRTSEVEPIVALFHVKPWNILESIIIKVRVFNTLYKYGACANLCETCICYLTRRVEILSCLE